MEDLEKAAQFNQRKDIISSRELEQYRVVQEIARDTIEFLKSFIREGVTEKEIAEAAEKRMKERGVEKFWYHGVGALVFVGKRTTLSISGRDYSPTETKVEANDLVTVDLSPEIEGLWGDFARTFVVAGGKVAEPEAVEKNNDTPEFSEGLQVEKKLHQEFQKILRVDMTLDEAYHLINALIGEWGYDNLDFKKNLGHSIEKDQNDRVYIESGNMKKFGEIKLFTFEPHIRKAGGKYGFKREDVYYFKDGKLSVL